MPKKPWRKPKPNYDALKRKPVSAVIVRILKGARRREEGFDSKAAICSNCQSVQAEHMDAQPVRVNTRNEGRGGETYLLLRLEKRGREENLALWKSST